MCKEFAAKITVYNPIWYAMCDFFTVCRGWIFLHKIRAISQYKS